MALLELSPKDDHWIAERNKQRQANIEAQPNHPLLNPPESQARGLSITKHYPGGQDHDQSNHGRRGNPRQLGPNPGQTAVRIHGAPLFHPLYDTDTKQFGYKKLRLPNGDIAKFTLDDILASADTLKKGTRKRFLKTVQTQFDSYNIEPDKIESRLQTVLDSALERYEVMNAAGEAGVWRDREDLPGWMAQMERDVDRLETRSWAGDTPPFVDEMSEEMDAIIEHDEDGRWRWRPGAGDTLADIDDFYDTFHSSVLSTSRETGYGFDQGAAVTALISPKQSAIKNLEGSVDLMQLSERDQLLTGVTKDKTIVSLEKRIGDMADVVAKRKKSGKKVLTTTGQHLNSYQIQHLAESHESIRLLKANDLRPSQLPPFGHLMGINEQRRLLNGTDSKAGFGASAGWDPWYDAVTVLDGVAPADMIVGLKRRTFANNIMDPTDQFGRGDATIDFHIMDAGNFMKGADGVSQLTGASVNGISIGVRAHFAQGITDVVNNNQGRHPLLSVPLHGQQIIWAEWQRGADGKELTWTSVGGDVHHLQRINGDAKKGPKLLVERKT